MLSYAQLPATAVNLPATLQDLRNQMDNIREASTLSSSHMDLNGNLNNTLGLFVQRGSAQTGPLTKSTSGSSINRDEAHITNLRKEKNARKRKLNKERTKEAFALLKLAKTSNNYNNNDNQQNAATINSNRSNPNQCDNPRCQHAGVTSHTKQNCKFAPANHGKSVDELNKR
jgi:hypothetical protein